MKDFLKDYLSFNAKERTGIIIILSLILAAAFFPFLFNKLAAPSTITSEPFREINKADSATVNDPIYFKKKPGNELNKNYHNNYNKNESTINNHPLFYFDPNTATNKDWDNLGISSRITNTIRNYLAKGGHFFKPADLLKIYGLPREKALHLIPFVKIPANPNNSYAKPFNKNNTPNKKSDAGSIDINSVDSITLEMLPGIGPAYSRRIIRFRDKLGGFYTIDQVGETYGLPDSTFKKIKGKIFLKVDKLKKININSADLDQLRSHPYIRYKLANLIVAYRNQHGRFNNISDLKNIVIINDELYQKIEPYLTLQ